MEKFTVLFLLGLLSTVYAMQKPGGITDNEKVATEEVNGFVLKTSPEIKAKAAAALVSSGGSSTANTPNVFANDIPIALAYKTQVVAGTNYFIKTKLGDKIFHVRIYKDFKGNLSVHSVKGPVNEADPIAYF